MNVLELRKVKSKNKKYKWIYQLIVNDEAVFSRTSSKEYLGAVIYKDGENLKCHMFFSSISAITLRARANQIALTFEALRLYR